MTTRRKFIAGAAAMVIGSTAYGQKEKKGNNPLVHHVFFWLKNPESKEDLAKLIEGVNSLKKIKSLKLVKIGVPALTEKRDVIDNSYNLSLLTMFDDIKGHDAYQVDPIHTHFVETYSPLWNKVIVYDSMDF
jgi:hypothetical protein